MAKEQILPYELLDHFIDIKNKTNENDVSWLNKDPFLKKIKSCKKPSFFNESDYLYIECTDVNDNNITNIKKYTIQLSDKVNVHKKIASIEHKLNNFNYKDEILYLMENLDIHRSSSGKYYLMSDFMNAFESIDMMDTSLSQLIEDLEHELTEESAMFDNLESQLTDKIIILLKEYNNYVQDIVILKEYSNLIYVADEVNLIQQNCNITEQNEKYNKNELINCIKDNQLQIIQLQNKLRIHFNKLKTLNNDEDTNSLEQKKVLFFEIITIQQKISNLKSNLQEESILPGTLVEIHSSSNETYLMGIVQKVSDEKATISYLNKDTNTLKKNVFHIDDFDVKNITPIENFLNILKNALSYKPVVSNNFSINKQNNEFTFNITFDTITLYPTNESKKLSKNMLNKLTNNELIQKQSSLTKFIKQICKDHDYKYDQNLFFEIKKKFLKLEYTDIPMNQRTYWDIFKKWIFNTTKTICNNHPKLLNELNQLDVSELIKHINEKFDNRYTFEQWKLDNPDWDQQNTNTDNVQPSFDYKEKGFIGLQNMGNTCYMNAVLQIFIHTKYFRNALSILHKENTLENRLLLKYLYQLIQFSNTTNEPFVSTEYIEPVQSVLNDNFALGEQHSVYELFVSMISIIHNSLLEPLYKYEKNQEDLSILNKHIIVDSFYKDIPDNNEYTFSMIQSTAFLQEQRKILNDLLFNTKRSLMSELFSFVVKESLINKECIDMESNINEKLYKTQLIKTNHLSLQIPKTNRHFWTCKKCSYENLYAPNKELQTCDNCEALLNNIVDYTSNIKKVDYYRTTLFNLLDLYISEEFLRSDSSVPSNLCKGSYNFKTSDIMSCPRLLSLVILRNINNIRIDIPVDVPLDLDLNNYLDIQSNDKNSNKTLYELYGIIWHGGKSSKGGHYKTWVCSENNQWYELNDDVSTKITIRTSSHNGFDTEFISDHDEQDYSWNIHMVFYRQIGRFDYDPEIKTNYPMDKDETEEITQIDQIDELSKIDEIKEKLKENTDLLDDIKLKPDLESDEQSDLNQEIPLETDVEEDLDVDFDLIIPDNDYEYTELIVNFKNNPGIVKLANTKWIETGDGWILVDDSGEDIRFLVTTRKSSLQDGEKTVLDNELYYYNNEPDTVELYGKLLGGDNMKIMEIENNLYDGNILLN